MWFYQQLVCKNSPYCLQDPSPCLQTGLGLLCLRIKEVSTPTRVLIEPVQPHLPHITGICSSSLGLLVKLQLQSLYCRVFFMGREETSLYLHLPGPGKWIILENTNIVLCCAGFWLLFRCVWSAFCGFWWVIGIIVTNLVMMYCMEKRGWKGRKRKDPVGRYYLYL